MNPRLVQRAKRIYGEILLDVHEAEWQLELAKKLKSPAERMHELREDLIRKQNRLARYKKFLPDQVQNEL